MKDRPDPSISRRNFLLKSAAGVAAFAALTETSEGAAHKMDKANPKKPETPKDEPPDPMSTVDIHLTVNGNPHTLNVAAGRTLADVLRDDLGLRSVKVACGTAECGACTVLLNTRPVYSCSYPAVLADNGIIETVEGIGAASGGLHPIQQAFVDHDAAQCGYCTPGMVCATKAMLWRNPSPTDADIRSGLSGNVCRCGSYEKIARAVRSAAEKAR